ncbi:MAG: HAD family hydrolase [Chitinophagaceae bacterium]
MKKGIAFFDFDGTITTKDTLLEFIKYSGGALPFYAGFLLKSPYLIAYKLKLISNQTAKEKVLAYFFRGMAVDEFQLKCDRFANEIIPGLLRQGALGEIRELQQKGIDVVIVSASPENWIRQWASSINASLIATRLELKNGQLTGNILDKNCHGEEKVRRIREIYPLSEYENIYAYGDSSGDKPMLSLAKYPHYKPFR